VRDDGGQFHRAFVLLARGDDFLDESDPMGLRGSEFVTQEEVIHRVTPSGAADEAEVRAAKRGDAALGFHLAKTAIVGGDDNVTGEHHFDANGEADALHGGHDWLAAAAGQTERIDVLGGAGLRGRVRPEELRHVQAGGEIGADGAENADPEIGIAVEEGHRFRQLKHHVRVEGVLLRRIVDDDLQYAVVAFVIDASFGLDL
jgi:hypothetical protein